MKLITGMAKSLNMGVIAEGVETEEQLELLQALGCELVQGYLFSKPQPQVDSKIKSGGNESLSSARYQPGSHFSPRVFTDNKQVLSFTP